MKLASWAICSPLLITRVYGAAGSELSGGLPDCVSQCLESSYGESVNDFGVNATALCNGGEPNREVVGCISRGCSSLERFKIAQVQGHMCDAEPKAQRNDHYVLLAAEIPAWISPWLRVFSTWATCERLSLDDHVMVICGLLYTVFATLVHLACYVTTEVAAWDTAVQDVTNGLKLAYIAEIFELVCLYLSRMAILIVCLRIFPLGRHQIASCVAMVFITVFTIIFIFLRIFRCSPISMAWDGWAQDSENAKCLSQEVLAYAAAGFDIAFNVGLVLVLLLSVRRVATGTGPRLIATAMIGLGVFALAVSCFRLSRMVEFYTATKPIWDYHGRIIWMDVEVSTLVIVACLPNIWPSLTSVNPPSDLERQTPPTSSRPETEESSSGGTLTVKLKTSMSKLRQMSSFRAANVERNKKQAQSHLRLGDKIKGNVRTEIQGGQRFSIISQVGERFGIRVKTTTVTKVDHDKWHTEKGGVRQATEANE
ncbi:hypothetical protein FALBO_13707 [Fusarium albosuccineum]|uniref:Rhodopsin domain-containing protein n=1 Tax=Fusarium albosuccineum TaxID=1237068 RepID=A0A8H4KYA4_9HYPO|nr:hypothetical protein FALBO_13707 [Fusarium albosuccineum]